MKILLIGASGQLGVDLVKALSHHDLISPSHDVLDIVNKEEVLKFLLSQRPQLIINTAAFHQVDKCEIEIQTSFNVNGEAVRNLAMGAREIDATLLHFSTDYVFDGRTTQPYIEDYTPRPINVYGISKLSGEYLIESVWNKFFIVRTSGLYGEAGSGGKGSNFVETMLKKAHQRESIRVVNDQRLTPTSTKELARKTAELIETSYYGLYHITANGDCSWYEFAREIFTITEQEVDLLPTTSKDFQAMASRPEYSVLANHHLQKVGMDDLKDWKESLRDYLRPRIN